MFTLTVVKSHAESHGFQNLAVSPRTKRHWVIHTCQVPFTVYRNSTYAGAVLAEKDTVAPGADIQQQCLHLTHAAVLTWRGAAGIFFQEWSNCLYLNPGKIAKKYIFLKIRVSLATDTFQNWRCFMSFASQIWILEVFFILGQWSWREITLNKLARIRGNAPWPGLWGFYCWWVCC